MKYTDPDGRFDINIQSNFDPGSFSFGSNLVNGLRWLSIGTAVFNIWSDPSREDSPQKSLFTRGFKSEYEQTKFECNLFQTFNIGFSFVLGPIGPIYEFTASGLVNYLKENASTDLVAESPFSYLRTAEVELQRLDSLINTASSTNYKAFLKIQKSNLECEYLMNKISIYSGNIPLCEPQEFNKSFNDQSEKTKYYQQQWEIFKTTYSSAIEFWGLDNEGKILSTKFIDYQKYFNQIAGSDLWN